MGKKTLIYPIDIQFSIVSGPAGDGPAPPPSEEFARSRSSRHRWDRSPSASCSSPMEGDGDGSGADAGDGGRRRRPIHERLGPEPPADGHVEAVAFPDFLGELDGACEHPSVELTACACSSSSEATLVQEPDLKVTTVDSQDSNNPSVASPMLICFNLASPKESQAALCLGLLETSYIGPSHFKEMDELSDYGLPPKGPELGLEVGLGWNWAWSPVSLRKKALSRMTWNEIRSRRR
jgi:hypothetical protein